MRTVSDGQGGRLPATPACCGPWGSTSNIDEWMSLECSLYNSHSAGSWTTVAKFGEHGLDSPDALTAAGWVLHGINQNKVCGLSSPGCSGSAEYAAFLCDKLMGWREQCLTIVADVCSSCMLHIWVSLYSLYV